ncbi:alpha/beta hydrolase [Aurantimonas sp. DM33-3]|uniref:alpha/beta hydrolase n=1 Tax=Aurantimonas sp. DM33-3 TaxID=2766955 RepID=UPI00165296EC|nr:alpha/beta hydrolase [Aurantimonas sp. DM33-3]MBC6718602.1 alpha/beta hydrolase [Aurantimonas sp. DM33-3]
MTDAMLRDHEWQYNPRVSTPDADGYRDRASAASTSMRARRPDAIYDIPYGPGGNDRLDIFPGTPGGPAHLFLHGGYWRGRDKADYSYLADTFNSAGISLFVANYDLCPSVRLADIVRQTRLCMSAFPAVAADAGCDVGQLSASGHSAGAQLLAMCMVESARIPDGMKSVTLVSGIYDVSHVLSISINETIGLTQADVAPLSPLHLPLNGDRTVVDVIVGGDESAGWIAQSALFAERCQTIGLDARLLVQPGENHFSIMESYGDPGHDLARRIVTLCI